jgi:hypothetical protein
MWEVKSTELGFREGTSSSKLDYKVAPAASFMVKRINRLRLTTVRRFVCAEGFYFEYFDGAVANHQPITIFAGRAFSQSGWLLQNE